MTRAHLSWTRPRGPVAVPIVVSVEKKIGNLMATGALGATVANEAAGSTLLKPPASLREKCLAACPHTSASESGSRSQERAAVVQRSPAHEQAAVVLRSPHCSEFVLRCSSAAHPFA